MLSRREEASAEGRCPQSAKQFAYAKPEALAEILETLATLGRAHREGEKYSA